MKELPKFRNGHRTFTWLANACRYSDAEVYLGLAPGIEARKLRLLGPQAMREFSQRTIPITSQVGTSETIPLQMFSVRDSSICMVENTGKNGDVPGFARVRLVFDLKEQTDGHHGNGDEKTPPVIAFLLTIGMQSDVEAHFFNGVVTQFLDRSWASFPKLLREVGCADPAAA